MSLLKVAKDFEHGYLSWIFFSVSVSAPETSVSWKTELLVLCFAVNKKLKNVLLSLRLWLFRETCQSLSCRYALLLIYINKTCRRNLFKHVSS